MPENREWPFIAFFHRFDPLRTGWKKKLVVLGVLLLLALGIGVCTSPHSWREEVQLSDGRVIVIERKLLMEGGGNELAVNRSGTKPKQYVIRFDHPDGSERKIEWRSTKKDIATWPEVPLVFDVESGVPVVYSILAVSLACAEYSKYTYGNGVWVEERLPKIFERHATNLLLRIGSGAVSLDAKENFNKEGRYRESLRYVGPDRRTCNR
ncbi:hypothetical protein E6C76_05200 [Pseudothauera nasutitermitis]|uniref:Uncharacterized protein n=1 Tax=Pseudothauera nasutitermitis TaxID=2565930 RepID=A0A4S4B128_9RHOO|nr:hypothetical protein [Pseudothauera nasutitermitis]THF66242.1 hypothetical protein E6C76_05200 [Pseudothauera nasutitermitis]